MDRLRKSRKSGVECTGKEVLRKGLVEKVGPLRGEETRTSRTWCVTRRYWTKGHSRFFGP